MKVANAHGETAHTIPICSRPNCGSSRHKHYTLVAMADLLIRGNAVQRHRRIEPDGSGEGIGSCFWNGCRPDRNTAHRGESLYGQKNTACVYGSRGGRFEARIPHCQGERQAFAQETLIIPASGPQPIRII
jgi:hypothetical protein